MRGEPAPLETRGQTLDRVKAILLGIDRLVGKVLEDKLGLLNQRLRTSLMNGVAATLGDTVIYHGRKALIQQRLWEAIDLPSARDCAGVNSRSTHVGKVRSAFRSARS
jgi:hypothetical protein